ncbi:unnamed protein product [Paramecium primaurelia]|uniref:Uncharacterized protein n=1 Tax=Paramecium primaurelia TaxID=5886 RepID=A0A8S1KMR2_PARPR|nr:unnamed protein product [Paramecium primaurelia]
MNQHLLIKNTNIESIIKTINKNEIVKIKFKDNCSQIMPCSYIQTQPSIQKIQMISKL